MSSPRPRLRTTFAALESRDFTLLFIAGIVAAIGGLLQQTANLWQVYELTGSAVLLGLTGIARAIPTIALSLIGGVIADRVNRRAIILTAQVANGLIAIALALLTWSALVEVWHVYVATMVTTAFAVLSYPARTAIIPTLVPRAQLTNAVALNYSVYQIGRIVAPAMAGIGIAAFGIAPTYAVTGFAFVITFAMIARIYLGAAPSKPHESFAHALVAGLSFIRRRQPIILTLLLTDAAAMLFGSYQVLMPILADRLDAGPTGYGLLWSADAVGAVAGAFFIASLGDFPYKGYWIVGSILAYCASLAGLALAPWFVIVLGVCFALGFTDSMQATARNGVIQLVTPDVLRGRVSSFQQLMTLGMPSLGLGLMGAGAGFIGAPIALVIGAGTCALINLGMLGTRRDLRAKDLGALPSNEGPPTNEGPPRPIEAASTERPPAEATAR